MLTKQLNTRLMTLLTEAITRFVIENEDGDMQIVLRPYCNDDAVAFACAVNASLDTLRPWLLWAHDNFTEQEALRWFAAADTLRAKGEANEMGLFTEDGRLLGGAGLRYSRDRPEHCSIGYWVRSSEQRQGIASSAVHHLLNLAWQSPERNMVEILAVAQNFASRRVAEKCGGEFKGIKYGLIVLENGPVDTAVYQFHRV